MAQQPANRIGPLYWLKRRSRRFWIIIVAMLPVLYVASFGPACWIYSHAGIRETPEAYLPIGWLIDNAPHSIAITLINYAEFGMPPGSFVAVPCTADGILLPIYRDATE